MYTCPKCGGKANVNTNIVNFCLAKAAIVCSACGFSTTWHTSCTKEIAENGAVAEWKRLEEIKWNTQNIS